jgi:trypsin
LHASGGKDYKLTQIIIHPDYAKPSQLNNDIALLQIEGEFDLGTQDSDVIKLPAQDSDLTADAVVTVTGWGRLRNGVNDFPATLQTVDVPVVGRAKCTEQNRNILPVTTAMFCAGLPEGGKDACQVRTH